MAAQNRKTIILQTSVEMTPEQFQSLSEMVEGNDPKDRKVQALIAKATQDIANGGLLLSPEEVERITEATGVDPSSGEDLIPFLSASTGIEEGAHVFKARIDPVYMGQLETIAEFRGWPVGQVVQETVDACFENNWFEALPDQPRHVRMSEDEAKELEELLGGKFSTGTELARLLKQALSGGLFDDAAPESNVGQGEAA